MCHSSSQYSATSSKEAWLTLLYFLRMILFGGCDASMSILPEVGFLVLISHLLLSLMDMEGFSYVFARLLSCNLSYWWTTKWNLDELALLML